MFKNLFTKVKIKTQFLILPELNFEDEDEFFDLVKTQIVSLETAKNFDSFKELIYDNDKLTSIYDYEDQIKCNRILLQNEKGLPYKDFPKNKFLNIILNKVGINQLGGELPEEINFENNTNLKFQYLGFISCKNINLEFIDEHLHLLCPVYSDFSKIYIDYSVQNKIKLLDIDNDVDEIENVLDELQSTDQNVIYETLKFNIEEGNHLGEIGHSGIPLWVQYPEIPKCPKTNITMDFVIQLNLGPNIIQSPKNFPEKKLQFGGGNGNLFIFFSPKSKIACYIYQGT